MILGTSYLSSLTSEDAQWHWVLPNFFGWPFVVAFVAAVLSLFSVTIFMGSVSNTFDGTSFDLRRPYGKYQKGLNRVVVIGALVISLAWAFFTGQLGDTIIGTGACLFAYILLVLLGLDMIHQGPEIKKVLERRALAYEQERNQQRDRNT